MNVTLSHVAQPALDSPKLHGGNAADSSFIDTLGSAISQVESLQTSADHEVSGLLQGNGADLHSTMIAVEKADIAFQMMMQVRNKIVSAYQEIARLQF